MPKNGKVYDNKQDKQQNPTNPRSIEISDFPFLMLVK